MGVTMDIGLLDLSVVTDYLKEILSKYIEGPPSLESCPLWKGKDVKPFVTANPPDIGDSDNPFWISLYLFHVSQDKFQRNPLIDRGSQTASGKQLQPLALDLYYLVTAHCDGNSILEQQAMSTVLKYFHDHPTIQVNSLGPPKDFFVTMEIETADELGRLWQATTKPLRLSVVYKVSVVFMTPERPPEAAKKPTAWTVEAGPTDLSSADAVQVIGTFRRVTYTGPDNNPRAYELSPATATPDASFLLYGLNLGAQGKSDNVYLLRPDGSEQNVTAEWVDAHASTKDRFSLTIPRANAPSPGVYQLLAGNDLPNGDAKAVRSNATPFSIAALVDAAGGPIAGGDPIRIGGWGFAGGKAEVLLGTVPLSEGTGANDPRPGQFKVIDDATILFRVPPGLSAGLHAVRIRVSGVESVPAQWVELP
ncbi:MAG: DUF4255 domain-containing protein [Armatimonadota bacterium]|nr:DUF4255 domain-containing protein [Armatimonadota bacterium]